MGSVARVKLRNYLPLRHVEQVARFTPSAVVPRWTGFVVSPAGMAEFTPLQMVTRWRFTVALPFVLASRDFLFSGHLASHADAGHQ